MIAGNPHPSDASAGGGSPDRSRPAARSPGPIPRYALEVLAALTVLAVFVPFTPELPGMGNDPSWRFAINQAVAQGLVFGRDIVHPYGPYASVLTGHYHPATDGLMLGGSGLLGLGFALLLVTLARIADRRWTLLAFAGLSAAAMYPHEAVRDGPRDALLSSYPLLLALLTYRATSDGARGGAVSSRLGVVLPVLFVPLGLLPLVKVSFLLVCGPLAACCILLLLRDGRGTTAALCALVPPLAGILLWTASGQPVPGLPGYLRSMKPVIEGYTEAMSLVGDASEIAIYLAASAAVLYAVVTDRAGSMARGALGAICCAVFLFGSFKEGFVRHDGHAMVAGTAILLAAMGGALALRNGAVTRTAVILLGITACAYIDSHYVPLSAGRLIGNTLDAHGDAWRGAGVRLSARDGWRSRFDEALAAIARRVPVRPLHGSADIYSFNQTFLYASGHSWSPRPVFQSYQAYGAELARLNADHLRGGGAPEHVVFRVEPIDGRLPALEDGPSWPLLMNNYQVTGADASFLYMKRRSDPAGDRASTTIYSGRHALGSEVPLPATGASDTVFAEIEVEASWLGRLWTILYKPPELRIAVDVTGGEPRTYRFVPGMARAGFILSPLVEDTNDFILLTAANRAPMATHIVTSFTISAVGGGSRFYKDSYSVTLRTLDVVRDTLIDEAPPAHRSR